MGVDRVISLGQVGPQGGADTAASAHRADRTGALVVTQAHGQLYEQTSRSLVFSAANPAAQAVSVALATTYTGLCLTNPAGSGIKSCYSTCRILSNSSACGDC
jgi:hypothetical protein